ncbi:hypothetical protein IGI37_002198 [Enterococcus sp. AZ194]
MLFSKKRLVFMFVITLLTSLVEIVSTINDAAPVVQVGQGGISLFYQFQSGGGTELIGTICYFLWFLLIPLLYSNQAIRARTNHFDYLLISRFQNSRDYWINVLKTNAILTFIWMLSILLLRALLVNLFYDPFYFERVLTKGTLYYIFEDDLLNMMVSIIFTCLGMVVLSTLILILGMYLKNYIIYLPSGLIISILLMVAPVILGTPLLEDHNSFIISTLSINAIIAPALQPVGRYAPTFNGGLVFLVSLLFYSLVCYLLFSLRLKLDKKNGF